MTNQQTKLKPCKKPVDVKERRKQALRMREVQNLPYKAIAINLGMGSRSGAYGLVQEAKKAGITI